MRSAFVVTLFTFSVVSMPVFSEVVQPPAPTGPYRVGTESRHLVDKSRPEAFTEAADDHRELMIQFWYPADVDGSPETAPYFPENPDVQKALFRFVAIQPAKAEEALGHWRSHSVEGARLSHAATRYPVVLFSHGFGGYRGQNLSQMEELASRGYIVVAIEHTYCAAAVEFPDGRIVTLSTEFMNQKLGPDRTEIDKRYDDLARLWAADAAFVLDELARIRATAGDRFQARLDLDRVGMFGHSFGGATSGQMCLRDPRVKCGINMDGRAYGDSRVDGVERPIMILYAVRGVPDPTLLAMAGVDRETYDTMIQTMVAEFDLIANSAPEAYIVAFQRMDHFNFCDFAYFSELSPMRAAFVGDIEAQLGGERINHLVMEFFNRHLSGGTGEALLENASPEVQVKAFSKQVAP